ncbi:uncharacterized protein GGS25DRAFT_484742 [Hypoxylon fragiforme]|uniref:uncharacterized protein n=1 Tax=Hypoxylon fragiforme TaxID=63214 RepID=UPI0020C6A1F1|nr:uncharacterized protein GGS25DRAFT_484742 [Hypoxylon fragiforme]KAI2609424.1 hypothetical protein GGS25DRAFT_484742 [Hypoxylon fragiforme]
MMEYFTSKKVKKHREDKAEKKRVDEEKGKGKEKVKEKSEEKGKGKENAKKTGAEAVPSASTSSPEVVLESAENTPILDQDDEKFLERLTSRSDSAVSNVGNGDDETPPPLPPRIKTPVIEFDDSDSSSTASRDDSSGKKQESTQKEGKEDGKGKDKDKQGDEKDSQNKPKRFTFITNLSRNMTLKRKPGKHHDKEDKDGKHPDSSDTQHLAVPPADSTPSPHETQKEEIDIARVLEDLNLASSTDNKVFSLSRESAETLRRFTQVLKDLVNGVPTAYGDLVNLIEDRDNVLARSYEKLPKSLKKLVAQLPDKLTSSLGPELLAVAAEAQGLKVGEEAGKEGAKKLLSAGNLMELVTKPGAVVGLLKGIVNALKVRWPAFVGTNVLWSVAVFLLLSALWYCYKRGKEVRLEKEAAAAAEGEGGIVVEVEEAGEDEGDGEGKKETKLLEAADPNAKTLQPVSAAPSSAVESGKT